MATVGSVTDLASSGNNEIYWAASPRDEIASELYNRITQYFQWLNVSGLRARWLETYRYYYRGASTLGQILPAGEQGELSEMSTNQFRNILQHFIGMITQQDIIYECMAENTDRESLDETIIANGVLNYSLDHLNLRAVRYSTVELAVLHGMAFGIMDWDAAAGEQTGVDLPDMEVARENEASQVDQSINQSNQESAQASAEIGQPPPPPVEPPPFKPDLSGAIPIRAGEPEVWSASPWDVVEDYTNPKPKQTWYIYRKWVPKWDVSAKYAGLQDNGEYRDPELAEKINNLKTEFGKPENFRIAYNAFFTSSTDLIPVWHFVHDRTPAMPSGRRTVFLQEDLVLTDEALPYDEINVIRMSVSDQHNTYLGYSPAEDMKPLQKALDGIDSSLVTNLSTYGVGNVLVQRGSNVTLESLLGANNVIKYDGDAASAPRYMEPLKINPVLLEARAIWKGDEEQLAAVTSMMRGEPPANVKSGTYAALLQNLSIQFAQQLQRSDAQYMQCIGETLLSFYKKFANTPQMAVIVGRSKKAQLKSFSGENIQHVHRVSVKLGNPLTRTVSGRAGLADDLLQKGLIQDPKTYLTFIETGNIEVMYEAEEAEQLLIRGENEKLSDGIVPTALITDNHILHIKEHLATLNSPDLRDPSPKNSAAIQAVLNHVMAHGNLWQQLAMNPMLLAATGLPPPPPMMLPGMAGPGAPGQPAPAGGQSPRGGQPSQGMPPGSTPGDTQGPPQPSLPSDPSGNSVEG